MRSLQQLRLELSSNNLTIEVLTSILLQISKMNNLKGLDINIAGNRFKAEIFPLIFA